MSSPISTAPIVVPPSPKYSHSGHHEGSHSRHSSSSRPSNRSFTDPDPSGLRIKKRIIVCCDGTWQDGIAVTQRYLLTNILHLARAINHVDVRFNPPRPQIVFYQSGVGTESYAYVDALEGATGAGLGDKVQEAYAFIAHNYEPGDEIFLFGFSRGAYTARMVAMVIEHIGVLDRTEMDSFAQIFLDLIARGKAGDDKDKIKTLDDKLRHWTQPQSSGKQRAKFDDNTFSVKCVGVFDTVGALGMPHELKFGLIDDKVQTLFGFPDSKLGPHIEQAYQALAIEETRKDFICNKFEQTVAGKKKGQILEQCWFSGSHADVGGGFPQHDLSDIALFWMVAHIEGMLSMDIKYLKSRLQPSAPWGAQPPHSPLEGIYAIALTTVRPLPTSSGGITNEAIHISVREQKELPPNLAEVLKSCPQLVKPLLPLEEQIRMNWHYDPLKSPAQPFSEASDAAVGSKTSLFAKAKDLFLGAGTDPEKTVVSNSVETAPSVGKEAARRRRSSTWMSSLSRSKSLKANGPTSLVIQADANVTHLASFSHFASLVIDILRTERRS